MSKHLSICAIFILGFTLLLTVGTVMAQLGNSGSIEGVVKDASGGVIAGAKIEVSNPVSGFSREITSDSDGNFRIYVVTNGQITHCDGGRIFVLHPGRGRPLNGANDAIGDSDGRRIGDQHHR
jgi:hypothetical protein